MCVSFFSYAYRSNLELTPPLKPLLIHAILSQTQMCLSIFVVNRSVSLFSYSCLEYPNLLVLSFADFYETYDFRTELLPVTPLLIHAEVTIAFCN